MIKGLLRPGIENHYMPILWNDVVLPDLPQSQRLALLLDDLWQDPTIVALWLGGSLARGDGDRHSDIDLRIAVVPDDFESDAPPVSASRITSEAVACLPRKWADDISQFQLLLPDSELYDLVVQTTARTPTAEARRVLACRDAAFAELLAQDAHDPEVAFPPADPAQVREALVSFWIGQQKHQKVLARDLGLIAWKGEHLLRGELLRLYFILQTGTDCRHPNGLTIHSMTPVAQVIQSEYGTSTLEFLGAPLRSKHEIIAETARLRNEMARVGRALAEKLGFEYPYAIEEVALAGWSAFGTE